MIEKLLEYLKDLWRGYGGILGAARSSLWSKTRKDYLISVNYTCEISGTKGTLLDPIEVHHKKEYSHFPELENDMKNLIATRRSLHFWLCHLGNWKSINKNIEIDAQTWYLRIKNRP